MGRESFPKIDYVYVNAAVSVIEKLVITVKLRLSGERCFLVVFILARCSRS